MCFHGLDVSADQLGSVIERRRLCLPKGGHPTQFFNIGDKRLGVLVIFHLDGHSLRRSQWMPLISMGVRALQELSGSPFFRHLARAVVDKDLWRLYNRCDERSVRLGKTDDLETACGLALNSWL